MNTIIKPTILVADTDPAALAQTIRILSSNDYNVFSAVCHASAMSAAMKLELDLVICDLTLWMGIPGQDLIADIHQLPDREDVPVIFTSTGQGPNIIRRQHDFGGAYHLKKPLDTIVLSELVEKALWMPHLVRSHVKAPHFYTTTNSTTMASMGFQPTTPTHKI